MATKDCKNLATPYSATHYKGHDPTFTNRPHSEVTGIFNGQVKYAVTALIYIQHINQLMHLLKYIQKYKTPIKLSHISVPRCHHHGAILTKEYAL
jgi:hypothetical protein